MNSISRKQIVKRLFLNVQRHCRSPDEILLPLAGSLRNKTKQRGGSASAQRISEHSLIIGVKYSFFRLAQKHSYRFTARDHRLVDGRIRSPTWRIPAPDKTSAFQERELAEKNSDLTASAHVDEYLIVASVSRDNCLRALDVLINGEAALHSSSTLRGSNRPIMTHGNRTSLAPPRPATRSPRRLIRAFYFAHETRRGGRRRRRCQGRRQVSAWPTRHLLPEHGVK